MQVTGQTKQTDIVKSKIHQAIQLLDELNIDAWLLFERETPVLKDPTHEMVVGLDVVWTSAFLYTRRGDAIALVGNFDVNEFMRSGRFSRVQSYVQGAGESLRNLLSEVDPKSIAINYSVSDVASDGLTHGMYLLLMSYLEGTPYASRLRSSQELVSKLRARKLPEEVARLERAARLATEAWARVTEQIRVGMSEKEIGAVIDTEIRRTGGVPSFVTAVNAGSKSDPGHGGPTDALLAPGDLLHVDFGIMLDNYCSDIQRLIYFLRPDESQPPRESQRAFDTVAQIIEATRKISRPGVRGYEVDAVARKMLGDGGYAEYQHALGHQLGRSVHDGGAILGPQWERYGDTPMMPVEIGNVFTLELEIMLPRIGCVGLEEDVVVETSGTRFLCEPQTQLTVKG